MPKRLELLSELVPQAGVIALLVNPNSAGAERHDARFAGSGARKEGAAHHPEGRHGKRDRRRLRARSSNSQAGALLVGADAFFDSRREKLVALAARFAVPAIYEWREFADARRPDQLWAEPNGPWRQVGIYAGKILKGAKPADLPVQQPTTFELVVNLNTAKALGLTVPPSILARATEVIE